MLKAFFLTGAAILATTMITAPGNASEKLSPGHSQLAAQARVDAQEYSIAEIIAILDARGDGDAASETFFLSHTNRSAPNPSAAITSGEKQIAASLGVDAADYTLAELTAMAAARTEGDGASEAYLASHANRAEANSAEVVTAGEKQIAAKLGVDPSDYTLAELSVMLTEIYN
ncbi:MAG: hypothetical protein EOO38_12180 [Cytophagaceae bacterium]|nr:MAG: hypothetical protein EOO38_12180 [Cytophagaceae bacterium]